MLYTWKYYNVICKILWTWQVLKALFSLGMIFKFLWREAHYWEDLSKFPVVQGNAPPLIDCPWFITGPLDFQGAPPASLFWERESLQVKPPHLLSSTSPFPHLVCKKLTHSLSPTNSGKTDCLHGSMSPHSTIRAANQPTTASLLPFHLSDLRLGPLGLQEARTWKNHAKLAGSFNACFSRQNKKAEGSRLTVLW